MTSPHEHDAAQDDAAQDAAAQDPAAERSTRADLLPEEQVAGSADPQAQAAEILAESAERTEHSDAAESAQSRKWTSEQAT